MVMNIDGKVFAILEALKDEPIENKSKYSIIFSLLMD